MDLASIRKRLEYFRGVRENTADMLKKAQKSLENLREEANTAAKAQNILQTGAQRTQSFVQIRISQLVSLAMESVFTDPYKVNLEFDASRGKTIANLTFEKDGERINPLDASGGGAIDVAAFGLQVSLWSLQNPRSRNVLILDEPLKWLKGGALPEKGAQMMQQISRRLGLQIIMVSHSPELIEHADKVFEVTKENNVSKVREVHM